MHGEDKISTITDVKLTRHKLHVGSYDINYVVAGEGDPLILVHGLNVGWGQWYPNIKDLSKKFKVYAIDLPGAGASSTLDFSRSSLEESFVMVLEGFLKKLSLTSVNLIGHSIGAWVVAKVVLRKKVSVNKIILVDPLGFTLSVPFNQKLLTFYPVAKFLSRTVMKLSRNNMESFLRGVYVDNTILADEFIEYVYESMKSNNHPHPFLLLHKIVNFFSVKAEFDLRLQLRSILLPILVIVGEKDPIVSSKKVIEESKKIPSATVLEYKNVGHVPSTESSKRFNTDVLTFLQK
ncbi:MAG: hypothetical protein RI947_999 [Candidatus Parcubacteria bacterium]|jgi:2-hydroxy-6-oxonona-2,4-dienedioate hydrolase